MSIKTKHVPHILNDDYYTISVLLSESNTTRLIPRKLTYKVPNGVELPELSAARRIPGTCDSYVVVLINGTPTLALVDEIHEVPEIDLDSDEDYDWIVSVVDGNTYSKLRAQDEALVAQANAARKRHMREQLKAGLLLELQGEDNGESK